MVIGAEGLVIVCCFAW